MHSIPWIVNSLTSRHAFITATRLLSMRLGAVSRFSIWHLPPCRAVHGWLAGVWCVCEQSARLRMQAPAFAVVCTAVNAGTNVAPIKHTQLGQFGEAGGTKVQVLSPCTGHSSSPTETQTICVGAPTSWHADRADRSSGSLLEEKK